MPNAGDELHHFGWNACSSCLCPNAPHPHVERRYLVVPGLRSSRIHILDTKPDPQEPEDRQGDRAGGDGREGRLHPARTPSIAAPKASTSPRSATREGKAPGGVFLMDHETFDVLGRWEIDRGPQQLAYDAWWHLGHDTMVTSEWGTPDTFENGLVPEMLLGGKYGRRLHFWDLHKRKHLQEIDFGDEHQLVFELRPAHDPTKAYGFVGCVISLKDLSSSIWTWYRDGDNWAVKKVIEIPAEPADPDQLPPMLKGFKAVPPLVTDIDLSMDDRFLYVSCWGTGDLQQYDVSDPFSPKLTGKVRIGGIVVARHASRSRERRAQRRPADGRDQPRRQAGLLHQLALRRDRSRSSTPRASTAGWSSSMSSPDGGIAFDPNFFVDWPKAHRPHQVRLRGRRLLVGLLLLSVSAASGRDQSTEAS